MTDFVRSPIPEQSSGPSAEVALATVHDGRDLLQSRLQARQALPVERLERSFVDVLHRLLCPDDGGLLKWQIDQ